MLCSGKPTWSHNVCRVWRLDSAESFLICCVSYESTVGHGLKPRKKMHLESWGWTSKTFILSPANPGLSINCLLNSYPNLSSVPVSRPSCLKIWHLPPWPAFSSHPHAGTQDKMSQAIQHRNLWKTNGTAPPSWTYEWTHPPPPKKTHLIKSIQLPKVKPGPTENASWLNPSNSWTETLRANMPFNMP